MLIKSVTQNQSTSSIIIIIIGVVVTEVLLCLVLPLFTQPTSKKTVESLFQHFTTSPNHPRKRETKAEENIVQLLYFLVALRLLSRHIFSTTMTTESLLLCTYLTRAGIVKHGKSERWVNEYIRRRAAEKHQTLSSHRHVLGPASQPAYHPPTDHPFKLPTVVSV